MSRDEILRSRWNTLKEKISNQFGDGEPMDLDAIIYLIGIQELGQGYREFSKDEKVHLMHIAICTLLEPLGYYEFDFFDDDGWPHFTIREKLPNLKPGEQTVLMKEAVVHYFLQKGVLN